ncbi:hypothetical protein F0M21_05210 [Bacillus velezensis]|uniref:Uncharacterized protein n=2 Tax=Bacillus velezensis TaxID=492670 RepID=A0A4Y6ADD2_BACVZ|nr:hypothetical protein MUS_1044 [Bacillus velezensis YAU B9601-Y2]AGZ55718.1 hypothetical protein U471_10110 [Bacillus amyloliquefaciens CC178]AHK48569.1 hypothetical protein AJ82_05735 [Bacillus velezensis TrigoCor1448]AJK64725.1 hypothetical protein KHU1_0758 [Bacillus amyloliquefaciens KHG19]AKL75606.1 hypothetical protein ABH13_1004 [Bacillus velezensis]APH34987.1 hypothetical protein BHE96_05140 [Bacillus subtilis]APQ49799.1 hypothetical protein BSO20_06840 [Bacillus amyloliquefaciens]
MVFQQFIRVILPYKDGIQSQNNLLSSGEKINPFLKKKINLEREEQKSSVKHGNVRFNLSSPFIIS